MIDSSVSHDELFFINNVLKDYDYMKKEIKNSDNKCVWYNKKWQWFNRTIIIVNIYIDDYKNLAIVTSPRAVCVD